MQNTACLNPAWQLFSSLEKKVVLGAVACIWLVSITDYSCTCTCTCSIMYMYMYMYTVCVQYVYSMCTVAYMCNRPLCSDCVLWGIREKPLTSLSLIHKAVFTACSASPLPPQPGLPSLVTQPLGPVMSAVGGLRSSVVDTQYMYWCCTCMYMHVHACVCLYWCCTCVYMYMYMYMCMCVSVLVLYMYMNNHVHSAPQLERKKEKNREERKKNHTL